MPRHKAFTPEEVRSMARSHTRGMMNVLVSIARQPEAPPAARVAAANSVLERGWGKAMQEISSKSEVTVVIRKILSGETITLEHEPLALDTDIQNDDTDNQK